MLSNLYHHVDGRINIANKRIVHQASLSGDDARHKNNHVNAPHQHGQKFIAGIF
jgi:hypothetical protein